MGIFFYNIFLFLFRVGIQVLALFDGKARKWVNGRKDIFSRLRQAIPENLPLIWIHCASLGEFEQGRPIMERLKMDYPGYKLLLTFFSPSGFEVRKDYGGADWVFYLPMDSARNAKKFLEITRPTLVIFVKYEFWYYYLKKIKYRDIPLLLVSALFRKDMSFFKWYGGLQRKILSRFDHLFVQNTASKQLIDNIGLGHICSVSGDTRFDRVIEIADKFQPVPAIERFINGQPSLVAGSTWPEDEAALLSAFSQLRTPGLKLVIAPHEIQQKRIDTLRTLFPGAILFSEANSKDLTLARVLIIDNYGMLSQIYRYGTLTYVGGGLKSKGIHNVLEAAVFNKIVLFGPHYQKYSEAVGLVQAGGGLAFHSDVNNGDMLRELIDALLSDEREYRFRSNAAGEFVRSQKGATQKIMNYIQEKRLLTR